MSDSKASDPEYTLLKLGKDEIYIAPITWDLLEQVFPLFDAKKESPDNTERNVIGTAMQVIAIACSKDNPEVNLAWIKARLTFKNREAFLATYVELLDKSGFSSSGEAETAVRDGTETSSPSLPNVSVEGFAEEIGTE